MYKLIKIPQENKLQKNILNKLIKLSEENKKIKIQFALTEKKNQQLIEKINQELNNLKYEVNNQLDLIEKQNQELYNLKYNIDILYI